MNFVIHTFNAFSVLSGLAVGKVSEKEIDQNLADHLVYGQGDIEMTFWNDTPYPEQELIQAEKISIKGFLATTRKDKIGFAKQALQKSEKCADAWTLLAENEAETLEKAYEISAKAVKFGEEALLRLDPQFFEKNKGNFWDMVETRPYIRAICCHSSVLVEMGKGKEAEELLRKGLKLNPGDNRGMEMILMRAYLEQGKWDEMNAVAMKKSRDFPQAALAFYKFNEALYQFRQKKNPDGALMTLSKALSSNPFLAYMFTGHLVPTDLQPPFWSPRSQNEANIYYMNYGRFWDEEARLWMKDMMMAGLSLHPCEHCSKNIQTGYGLMKQAERQADGKNRNQALKLLTRALELFPLEHPLMMQVKSKRAQVHADLGQNSEALADAQQVLGCNLVTFLAPRMKDDKEISQVKLCDQMMEPVREKCRQIIVQIKGGNLRTIDVEQEIAAINREHHHHHHGCVHCDYCMKEQAEVPFKLCARCHRARYCSRECQKGAWPEHKKECTPHAESTK